MIVNQESKVKNQKCEDDEATTCSTIRYLMQKGTRILREAGLESPNRDAELILCEVTGYSRSELYLQERNEAGPPQVESFWHAIDARRKRFPLQYILGKQAFRYLDIEIDEGVFIPRPETELVVEEALKVAGRMQPPLTVVDVCTGSGAIAVSIAHEMEGTRVFALDLSSRALCMARRNASAYHVGHRVRSFKSNLLSALPFSLRQRIDLIVANPPYVATSLLPSLQPELFFEPVMALDGGEDGLRFYPPLIRQSYLYLKPGGALVAELGESAEAVRAFFVEGGFSAVELVPDLNGHPRVILGYKEYKDT